MTPPRRKTGAPKARTAAKGLGPTSAELAAWLAASDQTWVVNARPVSAATWSDPHRRAQYFCQRAALGLYYLHDEPAAGGARLIYFGVRN